MIRYHDQVRDHLVDPTEVHPHPENANNGDIDAIVESITINGCYRPVYASRATGNIIAGNNLYAALMSMGATSIPVMWVDIDQDTERRVLLADNKIARRAVIDEALEADLLSTIKDTGTGFLGTGYDDRDYDLLLATLDDRNNEPLVLDNAEPEAGQEDLINIVTCPQCDYTWTRGKHGQAHLP